MSEEGNRNPWCAGIKSMSPFRHPGSFANLLMQSHMPVCNSPVVILQKGIGWLGEAGAALE